VGSEEGLPHTGVGGGIPGSVLSLTRHLLLSIIISLPLALAMFMEFPFFLLRIAGITAVAYYFLIFFTDALVRKRSSGWSFQSISIG